MTRIIDAMTGGIFGIAATCAALLAITMLDTGASLKGPLAFGLILAGLLLFGLVFAEKHFKAKPA